MKILILIEKIRDKLLSIYRRELIKEKINSPHKKFKILGKVYIMNRNVTLGKNVTIYPGVTIFGDGPIYIGENTKIGNNTVIYASKGGGVTIGSNVAIAASCYIIDADHGLKKGLPVSKQEMHISPIIIRDNVWLAAHVVVLKGSIINNGAVVGAMSLVNNELPAESINVGIPSKLLKYK